MTYSSTNQDEIILDNDGSPTNQPMGSSSISRLVSQSTDDIIPPQAPLNYTTFTNPTTGALYYYIKGGENSYSITKNYKNSWVFNPHDKEFNPNPPFDPEKGNLWVDRNNAYLVYVYNNGESTLGDYGWMALTTKKRAYDYFLLQLAETPDQLAPVIDTTLTYSIYKQGYIYYNINDLNLYIWNGDTDEWGSPISGSNAADAWVTITQHELNPNEAVQSTFTLLKQEIATLEADVAALKAQAST